MNCLICRQANLVHGFTDISLGRDEIRFSINHVPAQICPNCGEAVLTEEVAGRVLIMAEQAVDAGSFEESHDYSP